MQDDEGQFVQFSDNRIVVRWSKRKRIVQEMLQIQKIKIFSYDIFTDNTFNKGYSIGPAKCEYSG